jgi:ankyrin repeat protein
MLQIVQVLVEHGAIVNEKYVKKKNATPLHMAAKKGHLEICKYLLKKGANRSVVDDGNNSPRDVAADEGHLELEELLK